jgi:hypothetical protein
MRRLLLGTVGALVLAFAVTGAASAVTLTESGDAGSLPGDAQTTTGAVDLIAGALRAASDEDIYRICLTGGKTFSATTEGSQLVDPQLFLFDATGRGVYGNDDFSVDFSGLQSTLPAGHRLTPSAGGVYYLAISSFVNRPVSQGGQIFDYGPTSYPILEPIGPGSGSPVTGWSDDGFETGPYRIALTGTRPCLPTTKEECKNGRWRGFGFKNQGDCVSFVATGGKNPPGGN